MSPAPVRWLVQEAHGHEFVGKLAKVVESIHASTTFGQKHWGWPARDENLIGATDSNFRGFNGRPSQGRVVNEMETMNIASVGSALPKHYYPQAVLSAALKKYWNGRLDRPDVVDRMHKNSAVDGRYLALPVDAYYKLNTWGEANDVWIECAMELGKLALCRALAGAGLSPQELMRCSWFRSPASPVHRSMPDWLTA